MAQDSATLLTLPCELRNVIYGYIFDTGYNGNSMPTFQDKPDELAAALGIPHRYTTNNIRAIDDDVCTRLSLLQTCRQIHDEANLLALSNTPFHITGDCTYPDLFSLRSRDLSPHKISAIRHLTLTAKISHLRAMNEEWNGLPFGNAHLHLDTLTIVPKRADAGYSAYAEVADLSQSHTLAYIFAETLKTLKGVGTVIVRNDGCFKDVVWGVLYRSLVYRMWRWGGNNSGLRFECDLEKGESFSVFLHMDDRHGIDCGAEVLKLLGGSRKDTQLVETDHV